jgi:hypothetical protein
MNRMDRELVDKHFQQQKLIQVYCKDQLEQHLLHTKTNEWYIEEEQLYMTYTAINTPFISKIRH